MWTRRRGRHGRHGHNRENIPEYSCRTLSYQESWHSQGASLGTSFHSHYFQKVFSNSTFPTNARTSPYSKFPSWMKLRDLTRHSSWHSAGLFQTPISLPTKSGTNVCAPPWFKSETHMHFITDSNIQYQNKKMSWIWMPHSTATDASLHFTKYM